MKFKIKVFEMFCFICKNQRVFFQILQFIFIFIYLLGPSMPSPGTLRRPPGMHPRPLALQPHLGQPKHLAWAFCVLWVDPCLSLSAAVPCFWGCSRLFLDLLVTLCASGHCWTCWCHWAAPALVLSMQVNTWPRCPLQLPPCHPLQSWSASADLAGSFLTLWAR